jgi:hypothetical protein
LLKRVEPDVKKIVAWTHNSHKAEDGDHLARVSLKGEKGLGKLVSNVGPDGVPGCKHPGIGGQKEDEEDGSDEDGSDEDGSDEDQSNGDQSDGEDGSGSESIGVGSKSETPGEGDEWTNSKDPSGERDGRANERGNSKDPAGEERNGRETKEKGEGAGSATESRKRRGAGNGADEPPAQITRLSTRGGKGGITSSDKGATPPVQAGGHGQLLQEASTEGGKKGKVGKEKPGGEGSRRAGGKNK